MLSLKMSKRWFRFFFLGRKLTKKQHPSSPVVVRSAVNIHYLMYTWIPSICPPDNKFGKRKRKNLIMKVAEPFFGHI